MNKIIFIIYILLQAPVTYSQPVNNEIARNYFYNFMIFMENHQYRMYDPSLLAGLKKNVCEVWHIENHAEPYSTSLQVITRKGILRLKPALNHLLRLNFNYARIPNNDHVERFIFSEINIYDLGRDPSLDNSEFYEVTFETEQRFSIVNKLYVRRFMYRPTENDKPKLVEEYYCFLVEEETH